MWRDELASSKACVGTEDEGNHGFVYGHAAIAPESQQASTFGWHSATDSQARPSKDKRYLSRRNQMAGIAVGSVNFPPSISNSSSASPV
jgi:hypothetical protein